MNPTPFIQLHIRPEIMRAIEAMGFENATDIQAQSIPLIQNGYDVIGRSQTGTGKTLAFGIPAIEKVETCLLYTSDAGSTRVPRPAAGMTAFLIFIGCVPPVSFN